MAKKIDKIKQIKLDLRSNDRDKVLKAIKSIESNGDVTVIPVLCDILIEGSDDKVKKVILELFSSFKDSNVANTMMDMIGDEKYSSIRRDLLVTVWNTNVDFSYFIDDFVAIATEGDFMDAVECLTIIENMEGPFMEESILESQLHLKNYLESGNMDDRQKAAIISEIAVLIKEFNENLSDL